MPKRKRSLYRDKRSKLYKNRNVGSSDGGDVTVVNVTPEGEDILKRSTFKNELKGLANKPPPKKKYIPHDSGNRIIHF